MIIAALDPGERRIGIAISDPTETLATPLTTLERRSWAEDRERLCRLLREVGAELVVVGVPLNADGTEGEPARRARRFGHRLASACGIPVVFWDEWLSTQEAQEVLIAAGRRRKDRRARLDAAAAAIILQRFLDARGRHRTTEEPDGADHRC
jgi:putative Holliday junction resolvase